MLPVQLVVFDIAGTTVADKGNVKESFISAFGRVGYSLPADEVDKMMGYRKKDAIQSLLEKFYPEQSYNHTLIEEIHFLFNSEMIHFYENDEDLQPLPHAEILFQRLKNKGIKVALNTGFTQVITNTILQKLNWHNNPLIDYVISSDEVTEGRPYPYMIIKIQNELSVADGEQVVKVGDTEVDILEGRNAGCGMVIGVTTGAYTREQLSTYQPDYIIDSLEEMPALLKM
jgi:phosphonatase-like hydrolase